MKMNGLVEPEDIDGSMNFKPRNGQENDEAGLSPVPESLESFID